MPAIILARLKIHTAEVCEAAGDPAVFLRRLHSLFDVYADRTRRHGKVGPPLTLLPHYSIPRPVLNQILKELSRIFQQNSNLALPLADALWADGGLETRELAAGILDLVEAVPPEPILNRLTTWARPDTDSYLLDHLLASGESRLQESRPDLWLQMIENWLDDPANPVKRMGLRALLSLARDSHFTNVPAIYRLLDPVLKAAPTDLSHELIEVIEALAARSPAETTFYLRQLVAGERFGPLPRLVRKCLPFFKGNHLEILKKTLSAG